jgi:putative membrane protein
MKNLFTLLAILGLGTAWAGSDKDKKLERQEQTAEKKAPSMMSGATAVNPTPASDPEILNAIMTFNTEEMNLSKLAREKTRTPRVKKFAETMFQEHARSNDRMASFRTQQNLQLQETRKSMKVKSKSHNTLENLQAKSGTEFDRAYMDAQVNLHRETLQAIEADYLQKTQNTHLRSMLQKTKTDVQHHLQQAQEIRANL